MAASSPTGPEAIRAGEVTISRATPLSSDASDAPSADTVTRAAGQHEDKWREGASAAEAAAGHGGRSGFLRQRRQSQHQESGESSRVSC